MLTGQPPFDAEHEVDLLLAVLHQDPAPPRQIEPSVPLDLEVIALKCLRKEPEHRYDSALTLADDLGRYLRSEPILARPASTLYRIRRLAMRHRALVAVVVILVGALSGVVGVVLRAKHHERRNALRADERQRLAAELGQTTTKLNLFLRIAYGLPPHSLEHEQELVRSHLKALQTQLIGADPYLQGTYERAIGQGFLTLGEYEPAIEHLKRAIGHGERTAGIHLALGQALGRHYEERASEIARMMAPEQAKLEIAKLRHEILVEARKELQAEKQSELMSAAYVRALLHFYSDDSDAEYDAALVEARKAQREAPWLIEPIDLELKINVQRFIEAVRRGKAQGAVEAQAVHDAAARAIDKARSYPDFYASFVDFTMYRAKDRMLNSGQLQDTDPFLLEAIERAKIALGLQPQSGPAHDQLADMYANRAYILANRHLDITEAFNAGIAAANEALAIAPPRSRAYIARSRLYLAQMIATQANGENSQEPAEKCLADARQAALIEPKSSDIGNMILISLGHIANVKQQQGISVDKEWAELFEVGRRVVDLRPDTPLPINNLASLYMEAAGDHSRHGRDATAELAQSRLLMQRLRSEHPDYLLGQGSMIDLESYELRAQFSTGHDVTEGARQMLAHAREMIKAHPEYLLANLRISDAYRILIASLLRHSADASTGAVIDEALAAELGFEASEGKWAMFEHRSELLIDKAKWLQKSKQSPEPVLTPLLQSLDAQHEASKERLGMLAALRAQALLIRADWLRDQKRTAPALAAVAAGLAAVAQSESSSELEKHFIQPWSGALLSIKAQLTRDPADRMNLADRAATILTAVVKEQPPLKYDFDRYLNSAQELVAKS